MIDEGIGYVEENTALNKGKVENHLGMATKENYESDHSYWKKVAKREFEKKEKKEE